MRILTLRKKGHEEVAEPTARPVLFSCRALWIGEPSGLDRVVKLRLTVMPPTNTLRYDGIKPFLYLAPAPQDTDGGSTGSPQAFVRVEGRYQRGHRWGLSPPFRRAWWEEFPDGWILMPRALELAPEEEQPEAKTLHDFMEDLGEGMVHIRPARTPYELGADAGMDAYRRWLRHRKLGEMADKLKTSAVWLTIAMIAGIIFMILITRGG